jgi:hypothetical protein
MSSTPSNNITYTHSSLLSRRTAISDTKALLAKVAQHRRDWLVQYPPTLHPERYLPEIIANQGLTVAYLTPWNKRQAAMVRQCEKYGLSVQRITSNKDACPSYSGDYGDEYADRVKMLCDEQGTSLGHLHRTGDLRCQPRCPFAATPSFTAGQDDVLIGPPVLAYTDGAREDRTLFVHGLTGDEFVISIKDPVGQLSPYIRAKTNLSGYEEFIRRRNKPTFRDYAHRSLRADQIDGERALEKEGHIHAPLAVFGLLFAETLNNGWETTYYHQDTPSGAVPTNRYEGLADRWTVGGLDYDRHRVVRDPGETPESDTIHILKLPDFSSASQVVGLDVAPIPWLWNACYGVNFSYESVYDMKTTRRFLRRAMNITVVQTASSFKPYDGGGVTTGRDGSVTLWAGAEFGKGPVVVSTKNALTNEYPEYEPCLLESDTSDHRQYRGDIQSITQQSPVIIAHGAPRPRNEVFQMWGAFRGESVPARSNQNNSFGEVGDKIRRQLMHSRVARATTNIGENGRGATIVLNTTAVPEWLRDLATSVDPLEILPANAHAKRRVARYLRVHSQDGGTAMIGNIENGAKVSERVARTATKLFVKQGWVTEHDLGGFPNEYEWNL